MNKRFKLYLKKKIFSIFWRIISSKIKNFLSVIFYQSTKWGGLLNEKFMLIASTLKYNKQSLCE